MLLCRGPVTILGAVCVDNRIFVLKEEGEGIYWVEYLPEDNAFEEAGIVCPYTTSDTLPHRLSSVEKFIW